MLKKRFIKFLIISFCFSLLISSCSNERLESSNLDFLNSPCAFKANVVLNGSSYEVEIESKDKNNVKITLLTPKSLNGTVLEYNNDKAYLHYGGLTIPLQDGGYSSKNGILIIKQILNLSENEFTGADVLKESGVKYCVQHYKTELGKVDVYFIEGAAFPEKILATLGGQSISITFVKNK